MAESREMLWWMTTASSRSRTAMVTVSFVCSLKRSQTGLAQRRMSRSALTALARSTSPKPSLYFSVAASCSTSLRSLNVVSSRYAVDLWISSSLETSVTPDHPRRDKNSITETALSTDCSEGLLRTTAHISADPTPPSASRLDPPVCPVWTPGRSTSWAGLLLPERSYVSHPGEGARTTICLLRRLPAADRLVSCGPLPQPVEAEEADIVAGKTLLGQVGHDLAYDAGELEAVPRAGRGDRDLRVVGVQVYDEVVVGGVGEHAGLQVHRGTAAVGEVSFGETPEELLVVGAGLAVDLVGFTGLAQVEVLAELEAWHAEDGEAVEAAFVHEQVEDGEGVRPEVIRPGRLQPGEDLPLRHGEPIEDIEEIPIPGAGGHHEPVGLVSAAVGSDAHAPFQRDPLQDPLVAVDLGPKRLGRHCVGDDAPLRREETSLGLDEC